MKKFLLLCGVATIAVASVALAEGETPTAATYSNRASAKLTTEIHIFSPITMTNGFLRFPSITTTNMNGSDSLKVKVNPDMTIDYGASTAQIIEDSEAMVSPITITGGNIGGYKSKYTAGEADAAALDTQYSDEFSFGVNGEHIVELSETIPMYVMNGNNATNTKCGEVSALVPEWHYTNYTDNGKGALELSIGGTFTLENFELNDGVARCEGSTTVTYIMDN